MISRLQRIHIVVDSDRILEKLVKMALWRSRGGFMEKSVKILVMLMSVIASGYSQVTLSTGWGPGKRSLSFDDPGKMDTKSLIGICHSLMMKLRQLMVCESRLLANFERSEDIDESSSHIYNNHRF